MKHELGPERPAYLDESWPGEYDLFAPLGTMTGIPQPLTLITTYKENGMTNACLHAWNTFAGDSGGYFAIIAGLGRGHTYANITRTGAFCVNFLTEAYYDACWRTIEHNGAETDELSAAGLTAEKAIRVDAPRVREAFMTLECRLTAEMDLSGKGQSVMVVGRVEHAAVDEGEFLFYLPDRYNHTKAAIDTGRIARLEVIRNAYEA